MQKITPFLWFDGNAKEAVDFYTSIFKDSKELSSHRMGPDGSMFTGSIQLAGQEFMVLDGGPQFKFTEAISLFVSCEDQAEVDMYWEKLSAGGEEQVCGWLKDKFGLSWQIIPKDLPKYLHSGDSERTARVMEVFMKMKKIDIAKLKEAYGQEAVAS